MGTLIIIPSSIGVAYQLAFLILINLAALIVILKDRMWNKLPSKSPAVYEY